MLPYISATPEETIFERCLLFRKMLCRYSSPGRRVVLCGDAAHAMHSVRGQGANMTFEDAHCLGLALEARGVGPQAVRLYERVRIPRANMVQWESNTYYKKQFEKNTSMEWKFKYVGPLHIHPPSDWMHFAWYIHRGWEPCLTLLFFCVVFVSPSSIRRRHRFLNFQKYVPLIDLH